MIKINQLTFTRFIAAMLVFIYHYGHGTFFIPDGPNSGLGYFFSKGNISVSYFFVLSGFILYIVYCKKIKANQNIKLFFRARLIRILPAYFLALFLYIFCRVYFSSVSVSSQDFLMSFFLIQAWVPDHELILNIPGWSLSVEAFFYIIFPFIIFYTNNVKRKILIIAFIIYFLLNQLVHIFSGDLGIPDSAHFYDPLMHLGGFLLGIMFGILFVEGIFVKFIKKYSGIIMILMMIIFCYTLSFVGFVRLNYHNGLLAPVFGMFILALALNNSWLSKLFSLKPLVFLGDISYGFYIYQYPSLFVTSYIQDKLNFDTEPPIFLFHLACLIAISSISYLVIEKPLRVWVMSKEPVSFRGLFFNTKY